MVRFSGVAFRQSIKGALLRATCLSSSLIFLNILGASSALAACTNPDANSTNCVGGSSVGGDFVAANGTPYAGGDYDVLLNNHTITSGDVAIDTSASAGSRASLTMDTSAITAGSAIVTADLGSFVDLSQGSSISGGASYGIAAGALSGDASVFVHDSSSVSGALAGIVAFGGGGIATVETADGNIVGTSGHGIAAGGSEGVNITTGAGSISGLGDDGIYATIYSSWFSSGGDVNILTGAGSITGLNFGIDADNSSGSIFITSGTGDVTGQLNSGIFAIASGSSGDVVVDAQTNNTKVSGGFSGIVAETSWGKATVVTGAGDVTGQDYSGILARTSFGSVEVVTGDGKVTGLGGHGIQASAFFGDVSVETGGGDVTGLNGQGILAGTNGGNVFVSTGGGKINGSYDGINAASYGSGEVVVESGSGAVMGAFKGINASVGSGNVSVTTGTGAVTGIAEQGIFAISNGNGDAFVDAATNNSAVTGGLEGIVAGAAGGTAEVNTGAGAIIGKGGDGIYASGEFGSTVVTGSGAVSGQGNGIFAESNFGDILVKTASGNITGLAGDGIGALSNSEGDVVVNTGTGTLIGSDSGINAWVTSGDVSVTTGTGAVTGLSVRGIQAVAEDGNVTVDVNAVVKGSISGVDVEADAAHTATINNNKQIQNLSGLETDVAVEAFFGATTINNKGIIIGRVNTTDLNDVFNNNAMFMTQGTSDFGAGMGDVFNNKGLVLVGDNKGVAELTTFAGLEVFNNIIGGIALNDQVKGDGTQIVDKLKISGNYNGLGGNLALDAFVGAAGSKADQLVIDGDSSGSTSIFVTDTNAGAGTYNPTGILLVSVAGQSDASHFKLANGPINKGLFVYDLAYNAGAGQHLLVSLPGQQAYEPLGLISGLQDIADVGLNAGAAHIESVQETNRACGGDRVAENCNQSNIWLSAIGSTNHQADEQKVSTLNLTKTYNLNRDQTTMGLVGGLDVELNAAGTSVTLGAMGGFINSNVAFGKSTSTIGMQGAILGAYANLMSQGFFASGQVQAELLSDHFNMPALAPLGSTGDVNSRTIAARADFGYHFEADGLFVEPMLAISTSWSEVSNLKLGGSTVEFENATSAKVGAGARLGYNGEMMSASLTGRVWNELAGSNSVSIISSGPALPLSENMAGVSYEVAGKVDVQIDAGTSLFVSASGTFSNNEQSYAGQAGVNIKF